MRRLLALAILLWVSGAAAQDLGAALDRVRAMADSAAEHVPGLSLAVSVDGETVLARGWGYADLEHGVPVTPETRFRVASISKPLTAVAVALLAEAGQLDVDAPVQTYAPRFPEKRWTVTTRQIGGHLGGIRHYRGDEYFSARAYASVLDALRPFAADTLLHKPGTAYAYSTYGWTLVSAVVAGASGEPFLDHVAEHVTGPLGMTRTVPDRVRQIVPDRARPYDRLGGAFVHAPHVDNSVKWAGGGYLSTPADLLRLGAVVTSDTLGGTARALLFTEQRTSSGEGTGYGFGWGLGTDARGRRTVFHSGGAVGGTALLHVTPEAGVVVAMATNVTRADLSWVPRAAALLADAADAE